MRRLRTITLLAAALLSTGSALGEDKDPSLFVQPHTGAFLRLQEKEKKAVGKFSHLSRTGVRVDALLSAPIDADTREAPLFSVTGPAAAFSAKLGFGWDSRKNALALEPSERVPGVTNGGCLVMRGMEAFHGGCQVTTAEEQAWFDRWVDGGKPPITLKCDLANGKVDAGLAQELEKECALANGVLAGTASCPPRASTRLNACNAVEDFLAYYEQLRRAKGAAALSRDVVPVAHASDSNTYYAAMLEAAYSFDSVKIYQKSDIAAKSATKNAYDLELGPRFDLFLAPDWAFGLRAGWDLSHRVNVQAAKRCQNLVSTDATITGQSCEDVKLQKGDVTAESSGYARLSAMYLLRHALPSAVPGVEARLGLEELGRTAELQLRTTAFFSTTTGPVLSRFGIGVDVFLPVKTNSDEDKKAGKLRDVAPFLLIGASL